MANVYKSINEGFLRKYGDLDVAPKKTLKESVEKEKTEVVEAKKAEKLTGNAAKLKKAFPELNFGKSELKEDLKEDKIEELKIKIHDNPEAAALVKHILEILEECEDCKEEAEEEEEEETEETEEAEKEELTERWNHWYRLYVILGEDKEPIGADEFENIPEKYYDVKSESEAIKKAKQLHKLIKENNFEELKDFIGVQVVEILNDGDEFKTEAIYQTNEEAEKEELNESGIAVGKESAEDLAQDLTRYQKWVDYDMKKYGRISDITKRALEKASLELVKDDHGDYEVIAKEDDGKAIAESVAKRGGIGKRK